MTETLPLAVNGTLMRGLELNPNLLNVGATFLRESQTESTYRLFSINDIWLLDKYKYFNDLIFENWLDFIIVNLLYCKNKLLKFIRLSNELSSIVEI